MKKSELVFSALLVPVDFFALISAAITAYFLRFSQYFQQLRPIVFELPLKEYIALSILTSFLFIGIFAITGLYSLALRHRSLKEFSQIAISISAGILIITFFAFLQRELFSSRFIIISLWLLSIIFVMLGRLFVSTLKRYLVGKYGYGIHRLLIVGANGVGKTIAKEIKNKPFLGYRIVKILEDFSVSDLEKFSKEKNIDEIIQCNPELSGEKLSHLLDFCQENRIDFKFIPNLFQTQTSNIEIQTLAGIPIIEIKKTPLDGWGKIIKRTIDIIGSAVGLVVLSPFFLIIALAIKLDSPGPVLVKLKRITQGKEFYLYKFRSMIKGAEIMKDQLLSYNERADGPLFKMKNDPRITKVGKVIRRTRLDEFPQLINVLKGEMSLVGPRPHEPTEVAQYQKHHKKLLTIKPGITGLAQISGSSDLKFEEEVKLDTYYIENWSIGMDIQILFKTFVLLFTDRSAC